MEAKVVGNNKGLAEGFTKYFKAILEELEAAEKENYDEDSEKIENLRERDAEKITRVKPKRARKNSMGEEIFDVDEEEQNPSTNIEEAEIVDNQREQLLKQNDKFMRDLKKRKEEERKIMAEKAAEREKKDRAAAAAAKKVEPKPEDD